MHWERAYCYELYHPLRCLWPEGSNCILSGEVDKRRHPCFGSDKRRPDSLVHAPVESLSVVIEVKFREGARDRRKIKKDIETLVWSCYVFEVR